MPRPSTLDRFFAKVRRGDGCWEWAAARHVFGYGKFYFNGKPVDAHRASYELFIGPIPAGLQVLHSCDNAPCVRPDHLFLGTQQDNMRDMVSKRRDQHTSRSHCRNGHPFEGHNLITRTNWNGRLRRECRACGLEAQRQYRQRKREG